MPASTYNGTNRATRPDINQDHTRVAYGLWNTTKLELPILHISKARRFWKRGRMAAQSGPKIGFPAKSDSPG